MSAESSSAQAFGPNWVRVVLLLVAALVGYGFGQDFDPGRASVPPWAVSAVKVTLVAVPVALLCWLLSVRLTLDPVGVRCRSLLGQKEMRWDEVDEFYTGAVTTLVNGVIPMATRHSFRLKAGVNTEQRVEKVRYVATVKFTRTSVKDGTAARVVSFGSRFSRAWQIGTLLNEFTFPHLWRKVSQRYNDGLDVRFGDFTLSRQGVKVDLLGMFPDLNKKPIPWKDVRSYSVENGKFTLLYGTPTDAAKTYSAQRDVEQVANFRVMMTLLNQVRPMSVASPVSS